jgi:hypothetical protein
MVTMQLRSAVERAQVHRERAFFVQEGSALPQHCRQTHSIELPAVRPVSRLPRRRIHATTCPHRTAPRPDDQFHGEGSCRFRRWRSLRHWKAAARTFAANGAAVLVADGQADEAKLVSAEIEAAGGRAIAVEMDLSDSIGIDRTVSRAIGAFGRLDSLVNTASIVRPRPLEGCSMDDWKACFRVNVDSALSLEHRTERRIQDDHLLSPRQRWKRAGPTNCPML